jgi:hypothetical protein
MVEVRITVCEQDIVPARFLEFDYCAPTEVQQFMRMSWWSSEANRWSDGNWWQAIKPACLR